MTAAVDLAFQVGDKLSTTSLLFCKACAISHDPVAHWHCIGFAANAALCAAPEKRQQLGLAVTTWSGCTSLYLCLSSFQCHCSQMPGAKNLPAAHKQRWQAVNLTELHPELSYRQIGSKIGKSQTFASKWIRLARLHNSVADQSRSGRPHKLDAKAIQHILAAAKQKHCKCAAAITARVQQKSVLKVIVSTVQRALRREGLKHLRPKVVSMLTAKPRHTRTRFGTAAQRTDTVCWRVTMITDSSIFRMHPMGNPAGSWCTQATRGTVGRPKHGLGVHCYMTMTYWGVTTLKFVSGTLKLAQNYINPKKERAFMGVGSKEYNDVLQQHLIPEGKRLFQQAGRRADKWKLQQDNAPAHKTKENMQCISENVPGGLSLERPPISPDLSPIENLWACLEQQLGDRDGMSNTDDLPCRLMAVRDSITLTQLHDLFDGMDDRKKLVVKLQGSHIGKGSKLRTMLRSQEHAIGVHCTNEYTLTAIWELKTSVTSRRVKSVNVNLSCKSVSNNAPCTSLAELAIAFSSLYCCPQAISGPVAAPC